MADAISSIPAIQLSVLQLPEVAREQTPVLLQSQILGWQAPAIIRHEDQEAAETIQTVQQADSHDVPDSTAGDTSRQRPTYREPVRPPALKEKLIPLAAAHPRGLGRMVDVLA